MMVDDSALSKAILDNSKDDVWGGYYLLFRRVLFIFGIIGFGLIGYALSGSKIVAAICAGLSIGPLFHIEKRVIHRHQLHMQILEELK